MPHLNYSLLAWGIESHKIEQLPKKAIRVLYSKSPIAHTEPLFIKMNQSKLSDLYMPTSEIIIQVISEQIATIF